MKLVKQKLIEVVDYSKGKKPKNLGDESPQRNLPYIDIKAFEKNIVNQYASEEKVNICKPDDSLVVWDGARFGLTGSGMSGAVGSTIMKLSPKPFINSRLLFHFLQSKYLEINKNPKGVGIPHVNPSFFWNLEIPYPIDKQEQQNIVDKIEELFSVIDANISELKKTKAQLAQYKYAYSQKVILGLEKKSKKVKLSDVAESVRYGSSTKTTEDPNNGVTVLRMGNYDEFGKQTDSIYKYLPKDHKEFPELLLKDGDLLFNRTNSAELVGKTMVYSDQFPSPCSYASYLIRARFDEKKVNSKYVMYILNSLIGKSWIKKVVNQQVGQANVNGTKLKNFTFYLPSIDEQNSAVSLIENGFSIIDTNLETINQMIKKSDSLKQSILRQAFEGKLV